MCLSLSQWLSIIQTVALLATLGVIIWYACETQKLRKETVKQTELSLRPFVTITQSESATYSPEKGAETHPLLYKNIGHGPALDVEIKPFDAEGFLLKTEKRGLIEVGESKYLNIRGEGVDDTSDAFVQSVPVPSFTPKALQKRNSELEIILDISYKNIEKKSYSTKVKISREGIEVLSTGEAKQA